MNRLLLRRAAPLVFVLASACSDGASGEAASASPTLDELTLDKSAIKANALEDIKVSFSYSDPDGDAATLYIQLEAPGLQKDEPQKVSFDSKNVKSGQEQVVLRLGVPIKVSITATFWLTDAKGHESAKIARTIESQ